MNYFFLFIKTFLYFVKLSKLSLNGPEGIILLLPNIFFSLKQTNEILKNKNHDDPVTLADLEVNELIINRINQKYPDVNWNILSEENAKLNVDCFNKKSYKNQV